MSELRNVLSQPVFAAVGIVITVPFWYSTVKLVMFNGEDMMRLDG